MKVSVIWLAVAATTVLAGCSAASDDASKEAGTQQHAPVSAMSGAAATSPTRRCDTDLSLPAGFCAEVFDEGVGQGARHLAVRENGDVFIAKMGKQGGLFALRDSDRDGVADQQEQWSNLSGTAVVIRDQHVYFSTPETVMRFVLDATSLKPASDAEIIVDGYPDYRQHASKALAFDGDGGMYINVGAPSNACQKPSRTAGAPGQDPCPLLATTGGVWRFDADTPQQSGLDDGELFATGIRNGLAMAWNSNTDGLYLLQHGRDQLSELWPDIFTPEQRAELPAEEFFEVNKGDDFGWPYCYYDHQKKRKLLNPEYGGDGEKVGRCANFKQPLAAYPGHWAPNDVVFYANGAYPEHYRQGAFIAFHGSWNRAPYNQEGYRVVFQPFAGKRAAADYETFVNGFANSSELKSPGSAKYRPTGLAVDRQGQLWVSDSREGRIWRVSYSSN